MFDADQKAALAAPLSSAAVKSRDQAGRKLSYIEGWHAIAEANRIFGFDAWNRETIDLRQVHEPYQNEKGNWVVGYASKTRIAVAGVVREGCGFGSGIDRDLGRAHESALKESETDSMKRALMTFGNPFGLALYDKTQENVERAPPPAKATTVRIAPNAADTAAAKMVDQISMAISVESLESTKALIRPDFLRLPREQQKMVSDAAAATLAGLAAR